MNDSRELFPFFITIWVLFAASALFFWLNRDAKLKRKLWTPLSVAGMLVFLFFIYETGAPTDTYYFVIPFMILIWFLNNRLIKFCDNCGRTVRSQNPFSPAKFCPKCGAKLDDPERPNLPPGIGP